MSAWAGGGVRAGAECVVAPNPGPMTLDGTNTWVLRRPGGRAVVVDPGPLEESHLRQVAETAGAVAVTLLTHRHLDHSAGAAAFAAATGSPVRAVEPDLCLDAEPLADNEVVEADGLVLRVVATPGHTSDSVCLLTPDDGSVLTGDTVLGRGTSVVAHPDGRLGDYLESLRRLRALVEVEDVRQLWPGHGPVLDDPVAVLDGYLAHRAERLDEVSAALAAGAETPADVVRAVYGDLDEPLRSAAEASVRAALDHLRLRDSRFAG